MKLSVMAVVLLSWKCYQDLYCNSASNRRRLAEREKGRLEEERLKLDKIRNHIDEMISREQEVAFAGLVILRAYIGHRQKVAAAQACFRRLQGRRLGYREAQLAAELAGAAVATGAPLDELLEITAVVQSQVRGGRLEAFSLPGLNPCLRENVEPHVYVLYLLRGTVGQCRGNARGSLSIGLPPKRRSAAWVWLQKWLEA